MSDSAEAVFQAANEAAALFALPNHLLFDVHGTDAVRYLQGRLTQDINSLQPGSSARSLLLTPQGKILGQCVVLMQDDRLLLIADPGDGEKAFRSALLQFKVADQLEADSLNGSHKLYAVIGPASVELRQKIQAAMTDGSVIFVENKRSTCTGFDMLVANNQNEAVLKELKDLGLSEGSQDVLEMLRISAGIPEAGKDLNEKIIATDIDISDLVSFEKGCYAGQEVVEMSTARGRPNRRLVALSCAAKEAITVTAEISTAGKKCGFVSSSCYLSWSGESRFLAFIKTSVAEDAQLNLGETQCSYLK